MGPNIVEGALQLVVLLSGLLWAEMASPWHPAPLLSYGTRPPLEDNALGSEHSL